jgi:hypothetical protein
VYDYPRVSRNHHNIVFALRAPSVYNLDIKHSFVAPNIDLAIELQSNPPRPTSASGRIFILTPTLKRIFPLAMADKTSEPVAAGISLSPVPSKMGKEETGGGSIAAGENSSTDKSELFL